MTRLNGAEHVKAQSESGLSMAEYCRREGIPANSFYNWRAKLKGAAHFVKVSPSSRIELELSNGTRLFVPETDLGKVLGALNAL